MIIHTCFAEVCDLLTACSFLPLQGLLAEHMACSIVHERVFSIAGLTIWNAVPESVKIKQLSGVPRLTI